MRKTIREMRITRGWTQQRLADKIKLDRRRISDLENGVIGAHLNDLEAMAEVFRCAIEDIEIEPARSVGRPALDARALVARYRGENEYDPAPRYSAWNSLPAARASYPRLMSQLDPNLARWSKYLDQAPTDSCLEAIGHLLELRREALFCQAAPLAVGFDHFPVTERDSMRVVGHCPVPALVTPEWLMILQVTVRTPRRYTLDGLVVVRHPKRAYINVEYDGRGHQSRFDERRERDLGLATLRLTQRDVLADRGLTAHLQDMGYCVRP